MASHVPWVLCRVWVLLISIRMDGLLNLFLVLIRICPHPLPSSCIEELFNFKWLVVRRREYTRAPAPVYLRLFSTSAPSSSCRYCSLLLSQVGGRDRDRHFTRQFDMKQSVTRKGARAIADEMNPFLHLVVVVVVDFIDCCITRRRAGDYQRENRIT